jgi:Hemerythrin HHE cation binding domain.
MAMNKSHLTKAQKGVLGMLIDDHRKVQKIFKAFESESDSTKKQEMVWEACTDLTAHAEIEEKHFYPFLREADPDKFGDLLDEAVVEHASAKELVAQLMEMSPEDDLYDAKFTVLGEYTNHHIAEEEDELFPEVVKGEYDLTELEAPMLQTKQAILDNLEKAVKVA